MIAFIGKGRVNICMVKLSKILNFDYLNFVGETVKDLNFDYLNYVIKI